MDNANTSDKPCYVGTCGPLAPGSNIQPTCTHTRHEIHAVALSKMNDHAMRVPIPHKVYFSGQSTTRQEDDGCGIVEEKKRPIIENKINGPENMGSLLDFPIRM